LRDSKGRFIKGHAAIPDRDSKTGKFIKKNSMDSEDKYSMVSQEVDKILKEHKEV
jgi:hypothetical protein